MIYIKNILQGLTAAILALVCFGSFAFLFTNSTPKKDSLDTKSAVFADIYHLQNPPIPSNLNFAGEDVPLDRVDIKESLDRELLVNIFWQSNILMYCKRAYRYFPIIEPLLKANGIPDDFKYLCVAESGLQNVISPAKATGFWQIVKATGTRWNLEISDQVDERYHLKKSTIAACNYLKNSFKIHKSWTLSAAAYNMGDQGVQNAANLQSCDRYWDLYLNSETSRYVYRILAIKLILSDPEKYGIFLEKNDLYSPIKSQSINVDSTITDLYKFAKEQNITYKRLKDLNPWLISTQLPNPNKKVYQIDI